MELSLRSLWAVITMAMSGWHQGKLLIEHAVTISHDTLHVIVGVLLWLVLGLLTRRPLTSWQPWLWLFAIILWNEAVDLWTEIWPDHAQQFGEGLKDILLTMCIPALIMTAARVRPDLFRPGLGKRRR
ncbi:MAG: hypothetical protein ABIO80_01415 [Sphingomicrobium sp.]